MTNPAYAAAARQANPVLAAALAVRASSTWPMVRSRARSLARVACLALALVSSGASPGATPA